MKLIKRIFIGLVALVVILVLARNFIVKHALMTGLKIVTGLNVTAEEIDIGLISTDIGIKKLMVYNPDNYQDRIMVDMPEIFVKYDLASFFNKKIHLQEVRFHLSEFVVVKNEAGELNLTALQSIQKSKKEGQEEPQPVQERKEMPDVTIDYLSLKIGKVVYKDYSKGPEPVTKEYKINLEEEFRDIKDPHQLVKLIVSRALVQTTIGQLANINIDSLAGGMTGVLSQSGQIVGETVGQVSERMQDITGRVTSGAQEMVGAVKEVLQKGTEKVKDLLKLPFGKD